MRDRRGRRTPVGSGQRSGDKDAERVAGQIGVHAQRLLGVVAAVVQQPPAEADDAFVLHLQVLDRRHGQIQVQLLWYRAVWPGRFRQVIDLLESQLGDAVRGSQHQPVAAAFINSPRLGRLISRPVDQT
jgi:hypothetical protein